MFLYLLFRRFLRPAMALALSIMLSWSGCTAREAAPSSASEMVVIPEPEAFLLAELEENAIYRGDLILVSNAAPFRFPDELSLASVADGKNSAYYIRSTDLLLDSDALAAVNHLMGEFLAQGGSKTVNLVAAWRSEETQRYLYERNAVQYGAEHAARYVALPGCSEHHTGLAVDFSLYFPSGTSADFSGEGEYAWITENAHRFGLILRYTDEKEIVTGIASEPWHFRYVGLPHAAAMREMGRCLEEYLDYLRAFPYDGAHLFLKQGAVRYEVWYEKGSDVHLPIEGEYTVSGNNVDGLIVTRKLLDGDFVG